MKRTQKSQKRTKFLLLLIVLTAILSITATYAWFSTQRDVEITGMRLNVEVAESMQISLNGETWVQSIAITDMKQFYGTASSGHQAVTISETTTNQNYVPIELLPVSTAGELGTTTGAEGQLQFSTGVIVGKTISTVTACSEADFTGDAADTEVGDRESASGAGNAKHPFLVFDMYLRNVSANTANDSLRLNGGSMVFVDHKNASTPEGAGKASTGLEYSARVGFVRYGATVDINSTSATLAEDIRGLAAKDTTNSIDPQVAIWEPNHLHHTQYVVSNDSRVTGTTMTSAVATYGIVSGATTVTDVTKTEAVDDQTAEQVTFKPDYTLPSYDDATSKWTGGVTSVTVGTNTTGPEITDTSGNALGIAPNKISKVRVYVWLEGQDPDCIDMASTAGKLDITLKLDKTPAASATDVTYAGSGS